MITLHAVPSSIYGAKVRIVLRHKGLGAMVNDAATAGAETAGTVPCATEPVLRDADLELSDTEAMVDYLDGLRPLPAMLPATPESQGRERALSIFLTVRLEPAITRLATFVARETPRLDEILAGGEAVSTTLEAMAKMVDRRGRKRGGSATPALRSDTMPLLLGDCGYPAAFAWIETMDDAFDIKVAWPGAVRAYAAMLGERVAVAETMGPCRDAIRDWVGVRRG